MFAQTYSSQRFRGHDGTGKPKPGKARTKLAQPVCGQGQPTPTLPRTRGIPVDPVSAPRDPLPPSESASSVGGQRSRFSNLLLVRTFRVVCFQAVRLV